MSLPNEDITELLSALRVGERDAAERLIPLVYGELRKIAHGHMRSERPNHTLQTSALVHEAYFRLTGQRELDWRNRAHFYGVAAHLMRLILIDYANKHRAEKRGGGVSPASLDDIRIGQWDNIEDVIAVHQALEKLAAIDQRLARIVELRFFTGLTVDECAEVLGVSNGTVQNDWKLARAWLASALTLDPTRK